MWKEKNCLRTCQDPSISLGKGSLGILKDKLHYINA